MGHLQLPLRREMLTLHQLVRSMPIPSPGSHCSIVALLGCCRIGAPARRGAIQSFSPRRSFQIVAFHGKQDTPPPFLSHLSCTRPFSSRRLLPPTNTFHRPKAPDRCRLSPRKREEKTPVRQHPSIHERTFAVRRPLSFRSVGEPIRSPRPEWPRCRRGGRARASTRRRRRGSSASTWRGGRAAGGPAAERGARSPARRRLRSTSVRCSRWSAACAGWSPRRRRRLRAPGRRRGRRRTPRNRRRSGGSKRRSSALSATSSGWSARSRSASSIATAARWRPRSSPPSKRSYR